MSDKGLHSEIAGEADRACRGFIEDIEEAFRLRTR